MRSVSARAAAVGAVTVTLTACAASGSDGAPKSASPSSLTATSTPTRGAASPAIPPMKQYAAALVALRAAKTVTFTLHTTASNSTDDAGIDSDVRYDAASGRTWLTRTWRRESGIPRVTDVVIDATNAYIKDAVDYPHWTKLPSGQARAFRAIGAALTGKDNLGPLTYFVPETAKSDGRITGHIDLPWAFVALGLQRVIEQDDVRPYKGSLPATVTVEQGAVKTLEVSGKTYLENSDTWEKDFTDRQQDVLTQIWDTTGITMWTAVGEPITFPPVTPGTAV